MFHAAYHYHHTAKTARPGYTIFSLIIDGDRRLSVCQSACHSSNLYFIMKLFQEENLQGRTNYSVKSSEFLRNAHVDFLGDSKKRSRPRGNISITRDSDGAVERRTWLTTASPTPPLRALEGKGMVRHSPPCSSLLCRKLPPINITRFRDLSKNWREGCFTFQMVPRKLFN